MSDEHPSLSSSLNDILSEWNFENKFQTRYSIMIPWPQTLQILLAVSVVFLLFFNSYTITYQICTLSSSILEMIDHRLNHDEHSFPTEMRMIHEDALWSGNFQLHLEYLKFEMYSYNLLLKNENCLWLNRIVILYIDRGRA